MCNWRRDEALLHHMQCPRAVPSKPAQTGRYTGDTCLLRKEDLTWISCVLLTERFFSERFQSSNIPLIHLVIDYLVDT